ncbi:MAG: hypothetical protein ACLFUB_11870 [Cyclobacteriaceae bacterium]
MMKKAKFLAASLRDRIKIIQEEGNYLATRVNDHYYIKLYTWRGHYVEVWSSSHLPWQDVVKVKIFNDFRFLEPYLPNVFFSEMKYT